MLLRSLTAAETLPESAASFGRPPCARRPPTPFRVQFATELWNKIPRQAKVDPVAARMEAEKKAREQQIKARSYSLVDDEPEDAAPAPAPSAKAASSKLDPKAKNIRKHTDDLGVDDESLDLTAKRPKPADDIDEAGARG